MVEELLREIEALVGSDEFPESFIKRLAHNRNSKMGKGKEWLWAAYHA